jgi:hypothetical protein
MRNCLIPGYFFDYVNLLSSLFLFRCKEICSNIILIIDIRNVADLQALFKAGMMPIPLKKLHTLHINFISSDSIDADLVPAISLLLEGAVKLQSRFEATGRDWIKMWERQQM